jgi:hypothetical protein
MASKAKATTKAAAANETHSDEMAEQRAWKVATVLGREVTWGELHDAFETVRPAEGWKDPIDAVVDVAGDFELLKLREAVIFFTGSVPTFAPKFGAGLKPPTCRYRVTAAGYYAAVGA